METVSTIKKYAIIFVGAVVLLSAAPVHAGKLKGDARLAMREAEAISHAILLYYYTQSQLPPTLNDVVPQYLDFLPASPWGTAFTYTQNGNSYSISVPLPKAVCGTTELRISDGDWSGGWEVYPHCILTDEEKHNLTNSQLKRVASACGAYAVDHNEYPSNISQLVPTYISLIPGQDPYNGNYIYSLSPTGFTLSSYGRDHRPGGQFWDADAVITDSFTIQTIATRSHFEYAIDGTIKLRGHITAINAYYVDYSAFPDSLAELFPTYIHSYGGLDLYSQPMYYNRLTPDTYDIAAAGQDGIPGTEDYEVRIAGSSAGDPVPVFTPNMIGLYLGTHKTGIFEGGLFVPQP